MSRRIASHKNPYGSGLVKKGKYLQYRINVADWGLSELKRMVIPVSEEFKNASPYTFPYDQGNSIKMGAGNPWKQNWWNSSSQKKVGHIYTPTYEYTTLANALNELLPYTVQGISIYFPGYEVWRWEHDKESHRFKLEFFLACKRYTSDDGITLWNDNLTSFWNSNPVTTLSDETVNVRTGTSSLQIVADGSNTMYIWHEYSTDQDWSGYSFITFWWYGANTGTRFRFIVFTDRSDTTVWRAYYFYDDYIGWKRIVLPLRAWDSNGVGGAGSLTSVWKIQIDTSPYTQAGTWYLDEGILSNYIWSQIEVYVPQKLVDGVSGKITCWDRNTGDWHTESIQVNWESETWYVPDAYDNSKLIYLNGKSKYDLDGSETNVEGFAKYPHDTSGTTKNPKCDSTAPTITYSDSGGLIDKVGLAFAFPPYDYRFYNIIYFNGNSTVLKFPNVLDNKVFELEIHARIRSKKKSNLLECRSTAFTSGGSGLAIEDGSGTGKYKVGIGDGINFIWSSACINLSDYHWHTVKIISDGNSMDIYVDGELKESVDITSVNDPPIDLTEAKIGYGLAGYFQGWIDYFKLSVNGTIKIEYDTSKQETGGLPKLYDQSGNENHGNLENATWYINEEGGNSISACKLKLEIFYDDSRDPENYYGQSVYELKDTADYTIGLQNMSDPYMVALVTPSEDDHYLVLYIDNKQHLTGLMVCADENENIHWIEFSVADGTEWYVFEEWGNTQELDENNWSKFYKNWMKVGKKVS